MNIFKKVNVLWEAFGTTDFNNNFEIRDWVNRTKKNALNPYDTPNSKDLDSLREQISDLQREIGGMQKLLNIKLETVKPGKFLVKGQKRVNIEKRIMIGVDNYIYNIE